LLKATGINSKKASISLGAEQMFEQEIKRSILSFIQLYKMMYQMIPHVW